MHIPKINHMLSSFKAWPLRSLFPELSESQYRVAALYALGSSNQEAAIICGISESAVKKLLSRSRDALGLEELTSLRVLFNCRMMAGFYGIVSELQDKTKQEDTCEL